MAKREPVTLTDKEVEILIRGKEDPNLILEYFFSKRGKTGFQFDHNFRRPWQKSMCMASQRDIVIIGGVGTGKTVAVGMAGCVWSLTTHPDFRFMNAAPTAYQAKLMYRDILKRARGTRFEDLIWKSPEKPYPMIEIRFKVGDTEVVSTLEFMSVDKNANNIFSWEGDWANLEEGGLNDNLEEIITSVGTRLRGSADDRERLGRLSIITNPHENPTLWMYYDMAEGDPENFLAMTLSTYDNENVTEQQRDRMIKRIPVHDRKRFLLGERPEGKGIYFPADKVKHCVDDMYGDIIKARAEAGIPGYVIDTKHGAGVVYFTTPPKRHAPKSKLADLVANGEMPSAYVLIGDPGSGEAPFRNAPALMLFDVSEFPKMPARLAAFWWGAGHGSITPFVSMLIRFSIDYRLNNAYIDSTGPSKGTAELINNYIQSQRLDDAELKRWLGFSENNELPLNLGLPKDFEVIGMDFSGAKKPAYLTSGRILIEAARIVWPGIIHGIGAQLRNYDPLKDKENSKHAQDLVATLCMASYVLRIYLDIEPGGEDGDDTEESGQLDDYRSARLAGSSREQRAAVR